MARSRKTTLSSQIKKLERREEKQKKKDQEKREISTLEKKRDSLRKKLNK